MDAIDLERYRTTVLSRKKSFWTTLLKQKQLVFMSVPVLLYIILFFYVPTLGWVMAFQNFQPAKGFLHSAWVGLSNFRVLFADADFYRDFRNSICMSSLNLVFSFSTSIVLALLLNEIKNRFFKRAVQTISYLPHFLSWVIVCSLVVSTLSLDGAVNQLLLGLGIIQKPVVWLGQGNYFWGILTSANVWKEVGWNTIIYLAAIAAIDPALYEAAVMDGASRFQKMRYITLPGIKTTFVILLIMSIGWIMQAGFEPQYLLRNGMNIDFAETLDLYIIKYGFQMSNFSLATAAGILMSTINIAMLLTANYIAKKVGEERLI
ncbi:MAG TPA: ABC transporter permease subunit [Clostridia bacterium]|nr:ABC transporter permease subunit [Clostridia bacterium]